MIAISAAEHTLPIAPRKLSNRLNNSCRSITSRTISGNMATSQVLARFSARSACSKPSSVFSRPAASKLILRGGSVAHNLSNQQLRLLPASLPRRDISVYATSADQVTRRQYRKLVESLTEYDVKFVFQFEPFPTNCRCPLRGFVDLRTVPLSELVSGFRGAGHESEGSHA